MKKKLSLLLLITILISSLSVVAACQPEASLSKPENVYVASSSKMLMWDSVANARGYSIDVNGNKSEVPNNRFTLETLGYGTHIIRVKALGDGRNFADSKWSDPETYVYEKPSGLVFSLIKNNTMEYEVSAGTATGDIVIPEMYNGRPITAIAEGGFRSKGEIYSVTLTDKIKTIGDKAFQTCRELTTINFGSGLTKIGELAFSNCHMLASFVIPDTVTSIGPNSIASCSKLTSLTIGSGITHIGNKAFTNNGMLAEIEIPDTVLSIGEFAFANGGLKTIKIGKNVERIEASAFWNSRKLETVIFGESLTFIGDSAFSSCTSLESISIPESVTHVGNMAFNACTNLKSITISSNLNTMGRNAFNETAFWKDAETSFVYAGNWLVGSKDNTIVEVDVLEGTKGIAENVFYDYQKLESVTFPIELKTIGASAFYGCIKLANLELPQGLMSIGNLAFAYCTSLTDLIVPDSVKTIGNYAFLSCIELGKLAETEEETDAIVKIGLGVESIGSYAFNGTGLWNSSMNIVYADKWFVGSRDNSLSNVHLKEGTVGISNSAFSTLPDVSAVEMPSSLKYIGMYAFSGAVSLRAIYPPGEYTAENPIPDKVSISDSVIFLGDYAFQNCLSIRQVEIGEGITSIGKKTFYKCLSLESIIIPDHINSLGNEVFSECISLTNVQIGEGITSIPVSTFSACEALTNIIFGSNVTEIGEFAFFDCKALTEVTLPNKLISIGKGAFRACSMLSQIVFPDSVTDIAEYAFYGCESLTSVKLSNNLTKLNLYVFAKCELLSDFIIPDSVTSIDSYALLNCFSLTSLEIPSSVHTISNYAFMNCSGLTSLILTEDIINMGGHVFYGCSGLTIFTTLENLPKDWAVSWNSSNRSVLWGVTLSANNDYVVSFVKHGDLISNPKSIGGIGSPVRKGYTFTGWSLTQGGTVEFANADIISAEDNTELFAVWEEGEIDIAPPEENVD